MAKGFTVKANAPKASSKEPEWDYEKAKEFYKKSCDGGYANGCYNLGEMYYNGEGVCQD